MPYPFMPIQMTLISMFTIGIPSFVLALEPNHERIKGNFFINIISKSLPAAISVVLNIIIIAIITNLFHLSLGEFSTLSVILTGYTGILLLFKISVPFNTIRKGLLMFIIAGFSAGIIFGKSLFSLAHLNIYSILILISLIAFSTFLFLLILKLSEKAKFRFKQTKFSR